MELDAMEMTLLDERGWGCVQYTEWKVEEPVDVQTYS